MPPNGQELSADIAAFDSARELRPLAFWRAWDRDAPRTSQLRCLRQVAFTKELQIFGGNRTGKTELGRAILVAIALGSDHPDARAFWENHGVDPDRFPRGPDTGWIIAVTSNDSLRYHRDQILALVPKWGPRHPSTLGDGANWCGWNLHGRGEAHLEIMVPGYKQPAKIYFKSEDQGVEAVQGDAVRCIHHDEEGKTGRVYASASYRLIDKDGWQILTNTPIYGKTWTYKRFVESPESGSRMVRIHAKDNPYLPKHRVAKYADDNVRGKGEYADVEGRVWYPYDPTIHIVPRFELPSGVTRYRGIDFGTRHPFACLWFARLHHSLILPNGRRLHDGTIVAYREHYQAERTLAWHVARIRQAEGWRLKPGVVTEERSRPDDSWEPTSNSEEITITWADPEDPQLILQLAQLHGILAIKGRKEIQAGIDMVNFLLEPDSTGEPRLVFMDHLVNTIREVDGYVWTKSKTVEGVEKKEPSKLSDHTCDIIRYVAMGMRPNIRR